MKVISIALCLFMLSLTIGSFSSQYEENTIRLIVDTDGDIDDLIAIMLLDKFKCVNLLAITSTSNGKSRPPKVARNVLNFLEYIDKSDVPVAHTKPKSLCPIGNYPEALRDAADNVMNIQLPFNLNEPVGESSYKLLVNTILSSPKKVTLLCTGPLTNLALALKTKPSIKNNIERVYILGGALTVPGNILDRFNGFINRTAEYNMALDAKAAHIVLSSQLPITLIPLDVLRTISPMPTEIYRTLIQSPKSKSTSFVLKTIQPYHYPQITGEANFWGSLGVAHILNPFVCKTIYLNISINMSPGSEYGRLSIDKYGYPVDVCLSANFGLFFEIFTKALRE